MNFYIQQFAATVARCYIVETSQNANVLTLNCIDAVGTCVASRVFTDRQLLNGALMNLALEDLRNNLNMSVATLQ